MTRRRGLLIALAAALFAAYAATRGALLWRFPPFTDEALYAQWAWQGFNVPEDRFLALATGKEPLLPWAAMGWIKVGVEPLTAVRLVSVVAGLVTVVLAGLLARELGGRRAAWAAPGIAVVLPFFVVNDVVGIYDAVAAAAVAAAFLLQLRLAQRPSLGDALLLGFALAAGLLTKQTTYFAVALIPLGALVFDWRAPGRLRRFVAWIGGLLLALAVAGLAYSTMLLSQFYDDFRAAQEPEVTPAHGFGEGFRDLDHWLANNVPPYLDALVGYFTLPLLVLCAVGFGAVLARRLRLGLLAAAWVLVPVGAAVVLADVPYPRYLLTAAPPLVAFAGVGLVVVLDRLRARYPTGRVAVALATGVVFLLALPALAYDARVLANPSTATYPSRDDEGFATGWSSGSPWPSLADELRRRARGGPVLVALGEHHPIALQLLLRDTPGITLLRLDDERSAAARFGVENDQPLADPPGALRWQRVWTYERPRGGSIATLYASVVDAGGRLYAAPETLRAGLGLSDSEFDAFIAARPEIQRWYRAWFGEYG